MDWSNIPVYDDKQIDQISWLDIKCVELSLTQTEPFRPNAKIENKVALVKSECINRIVNK